MTSYNQFKPPPPAMFPGLSQQVDSAQISQIVGATPSNPYLTGLPVQFLTIPFDDDRTTNLESEIDIDFSITPFTYLNFSNLTEDDSDQFTVYLSNVPIGTIFILNGPTGWTGANGELVLRDTDSAGNPLPNATLSIEPRGTIATPSAYVNILVCRDDSGLVARAMS